MAQLLAEIAEPRPVAASGSSANYSYVAGTLVYYAGIWLQTWLTARLGGPHDLGMFGLALSVTQPAFGFSTLNLRPVQLTDANHEFSFATYMRTRVWLGLCALSVAVLLARLTGDSRVSLVVLGLCAARMSDGLSEVCQAVLMRSGRANRAAQCLLLRGVLSAVAIGITLFTKRNLVAAVAIMAAVSWALFLFHDVFLVSRIHAPRTGASGGFKQLFLRALPAGATAGLAILGPNIPVLVLRKMQGDAAVGLLYPLIHLQSSGIVAIVALAQSLSTHLAHSYLTGQLASFFQTGKRLVMRAVQLGCIAFVGALLMGPWIVQRVYGPGYKLPVAIVLIFSGSAAIAFVGAALGGVVTATRQFAKLWPPYLLVPLVAIVASAWLIPPFPRFGTPAAFVLISISTCISPLIAAARDKKLRAYF